MTGTANLPVERRGAIEIVTLDRPSVFNARSPELVGALLSATFDHEKVKRAFVEKRAPDYSG